MADPDESPEPDEPELEADEDAVPSDPPPPPYSYGSRDVQPAYESTWGSEPGIDADPWSEAD